jgi:hypothetical protein
VHGGRRRRARAEEERWWGCGHGVGDGGFRVVEDPGTEAELVESVAWSAEDRRQPVTVECSRRKMADGAGGRVVASASGFI